MKSLPWRMVADIILIVVLAAVLISRPGHSLLIVFSIIGVFPVVANAITGLLRRQLTIDLLASVALFFSMLAGDWNSAAFINLMLASARILDLWTQVRGKQIVAKLYKFRPEIVNLRSGDQVTHVPISQIRPGDEVVIEIGERLPVDGTVISGQASLDQATLTGESDPIAKKVGDKVYTSALNVSGSIIIRADRVGDDTRFAQVVNLVEEASRQKAPAESMANQFTQWYIVATIVGSALLYYFLRDKGLVLSVLLVICADDLAVAVPLGFTAAIVKAAKSGILLKGSSVLESLAKISYFITDKTGTLTRGLPEIKKIHIFSSARIPAYQVLGAAVTNSSHPVSKSILSYLQHEKIALVAPETFQEFPGEGIIASWHRGRIFSGKIEFLIHHQISISQEQRHLIDQAKSEGFGLSGFARNRRLLGLVVFTDQVRPHAASVIAATKQLGVKVWIMLTGDNANAAAQVAQAVGIDEYHADLSPQDKLEFIRHYKVSHPGVLAMIGDGVNDAAALALADVSFAMGQIGSDAAIEAADVAIMDDKLPKILTSLSLSKNTLSIIKQNFFLWGLANAVGLSLVFAGVLHPTGAAAYNFATDFIPILNSLRILL